MAATSELPDLVEGMRSRGSRTGVKMASPLKAIPTKKPRSRAFWWCLRKRPRNWVSERMVRQRLQMREALGSEDGFGGRRRKISWRRFSSSSGGTAAGQELVLSSSRTLGTRLAGIAEHRNLLASTHVMLGMGSTRSGTEGRSIISMRKLSSSSTLDTLLSSAGDSSSLWASAHCDSGMGTGPTLGGFRWAEVAGGATPFPRSSPDAVSYAGGVRGEIS